MKIVVFGRGLTGALQLSLWLSLIKKTPKVCSCSQIPAYCRGLNHKWHLYLRALTPLMKGKHLRPCWPCSLSAHTVIIPTVSLSLYRYLFSPLFPLPPVFFFRRHFSLSLSRFQLYHHFQVARLRRWTEVEESGGNTGPSMWLHVLTKTRIYTY